MIAVGSCEIGDKTFTDFSLTPSASGGATPLTPADIGYSTVPPPAGLFGFILGFTLNALAGQTNDLLVGWTISAPSPLIASLHLSQIGGFTGTGVARVDETYCLGSPVASCLPGNSFSLHTIQSAAETQLTDAAFFAPVSVLGVLKDINVSGGTDGTANITGVTNTVDQRIPEPTSLAILGVSLAMLRLIRRRKHLAEP